VHTAVSYGTTSFASCSDPHRSTSNPAETGPGAHISRIPVSLYAVIKIASRSVAQENELPRASGLSAVAHLLGQIAFLRRTLACPRIALAFLPRTPTKPPAVEIASIPSSYTTSERTTYSGLLKTSGATFYPTATAERRASNLHTRCQKTRTFALHSQNHLARSLRITVAVVSELHLG
jgi:hypothetical protein